MTTFGPAWTGALLLGSQSLGIPVSWPLRVIALESSFNPFARNTSGAFGLWQKMPDAQKRPYAVTDPVRQLNDAFAFWRAMVESMRVGTLTSCAAFYCLNLAPARLRNGAYNDETVLYEAPGASYRQNAAAFGLSPDATSGAIRIKHLEIGLAAAVARNQARYNAELAAATSPTVWLGTAGDPDLADPDRSELD